MEFSSIPSRPLHEIVTKMMKPSQNLYAQLLLLQVGARSGAPNVERQTTEDSGLAEFGKFP